MRIEQYAPLKEVRFFPASQPSREDILQLSERGFVWDRRGRFFFADDTPANRRRIQQLVARMQASGSALTTPGARPAPAPRPRAQHCPPAPECFASWLPVADIQADPERFQGREAHFSEESVQRILADFDPRRLDPITVWQEPGTGQYYVLSGHSRLEAHKRLRRTTIPAKVFEGTEAEAVAFSKGYANRLATAETLAEDVRTYALLRDGDPGRAVPPMEKKALRQMFGNRLEKLEMLSHLNPRGKFLDLMRQPADVQKQFPYLETKATWVGELRRRYPDRLTNAHEDEIFQYLLTTPRTLQLTKEDFFALVQKKVDNLLFDRDRPLALNVQTTETESRADTGPSQRRIYEIDRELQQLGERIRAARTQQEKDQLRAEILQLREERDQLQRGIATALKSQAALFG